MRIKVIFNIVILLIIILFSGCKKKEQIDVSNINDSVNNLIQNIPEEDFSEIETSKELEESYEVSELETIVTEEENLEIKEAILRTSEDVMPTFENFSFSLPATTLPETVTYLKNEWLVHAVDYVSTSLSLNTPSVYLYTTYVYDESKNIKKSDYDKNFKELIKNSLNKFGKYVNGENTFISSINDINAENRLSMIFDLTDCYVIEIISDTSTETTKGSVDVYLYFISKNNPHSSDDESPILEYIKSMIEDYKLSVYYTGEDGSYVIDYGKNSDYNKYIISKYLGD